MQKILVLIPAYNEEKMIGEVLQTLPKTIANAKMDWLVVDDGSSDMTAQVAQKHGAKVLFHFLNRGLGGALGTGFEYARNQNYAAVVTFDADGQHQAKDISRLIKPILERRADVVIGSRFLGNDALPMLRAIILRFSNVLTWLLFGVWTSDSQSGLRAFGKKAIANIQIRSERMEVSSEIFSEISRLRLRVMEIPVKPIYTRYSLHKGQQMSNAPRVLWQLMLQKLD